MRALLRASDLSMMQGWGGVGRIRDRKAQSKEANQVRFVPNNEQTEFGRNLVDGKGERGGGLIFLSRCQIDPNDPGASICGRPTLSAQPHRSVDPAPPSIRRACSPWPWPLSASGVHESPRLHAPLARTHTQQIWVPAQPRTGVHCPLKHMCIIDRVLSTWGRPVPPLRGAPVRPPCCSESQSDIKHTQ